MREHELSITLWLGGFMLSAIGILIAGFGSIVVYIFSRHREDNDCEHEEFRTTTSNLEREIIELKTEHNIFKGKCMHE